MARSSNYCMNNHLVIYYEICRLGNSKKQRNNEKFVFLDHFNLNIEDNEDLLTKTNIMSKFGVII